MDDKSSIPAGIQKGLNEGNIGLLDPIRKGASRFLVDNKKYEGQYVAMPSFNDRSIIAFGPNRSDVRRKAKSMGHTKSIVTYIFPK